MVVNEDSRPLPPKARSGSRPKQGPTKSPRQGQVRRESQATLLDLEGTFKGFGLTMEMVYACKREDLELES